MSKIISAILIAIIAFATQFFVLKKYKKNKKIDYKIIIVSIIVIGIIVRIAYILYTPITKRQHDVDVGSTVGQMAYIETIYKTGKLPENNVWQFYQQPLHHIISAIWLKVLTSTGIGLEQAEEGIQVLTATYSSLLMIVSYEILKELEIEDKYKLPLMIIMAIHPTFIILAGSINNDILSVLFTFLSILYIIKWYKKPSWKNTIIMALWVALGALTKIATTAIAIPILYIFIKKYFEDIYELKDRKVTTKYLTKIIVFGIIAMGIGLLFSVRNKIKFGQDLTYVPKPGSSLYCGDKSNWERLNPFSKEFADVFCHPFSDCNMVAYLVKSSLFGEYSIGGLQPAIIERLLTTTNIILILLTLVSIIKIIIGQKSNGAIKALIVFFITEIAMYIYGNFSMPYGCTMDFRYITPTILLGTIFITLEAKEKPKEYKQILSVIIIFAILSVIFELTHMSMLTV